MFVQSQCRCLPGPKSERLTVPPADIMKFCRRHDKPHHGLTFRAAITDQMTSSPKRHKKLNTKRLRLSYDFPAKRDCMENLKSVAKFMRPLVANFLISELCISWMNETGLMETLYSSECKKLLSSGAKRLRLLHNSRLKKSFCSTLFDFYFAHLFLSTIFAFD